MGVAAALITGTLHFDMDVTIDTSLVRVLSVICPRTMQETCTLEELRSRFRDLREVDFRLILAHPVIIWHEPILALNRERMVLRYRGQLAHGLSVTLYYPIQRVGLGRGLFFTVVTLVPLRMVMLLRDVHYDHLEIGNGHRQRGCSDMEAGNTGQILTEAGPSIHGVCSGPNFSGALR